MTDWPTSPAHTLHVPHYRIRLQIYDWTCVDPRFAGSELAGKVRIHVAVMSDTENKYTSFSQHWIYSGESMNAALTYAADATGIPAVRLRSMLPPKFARYLTKGVAC